jgi:hypothetical protein
VTVYGLRQAASSGLSATVVTEKLNLKLFRNVGYKRKKKLVRANCFLNFLLIDIEVCVDVLHVIMLFQRLD